MKPFLCWWNLIWCITFVTVWTNLNILASILGFFFHFTFNRCQLPFRVDEDELVYFVLSDVLMQIWHCFYLDEPNFDVLYFHDGINNFLMISPFSYMSYFVFLWVSSCTWNIEKHKIWMIFNDIIDQKQFLINSLWKHWNCTSFFIWVTMILFDFARWSYTELELYLF